MDKGNGGRRGFNYIWVLAGGYLIYLGVSLLYGVFRGNASSMALSLAGGVAFTAVGGALLLREWRRSGTAAAKDAAPKGGSPGTALPEETSDGEEEA